MKTKFFAFLLIVIFLFLSLYACGSVTPNESNQPNSSTQPDETTAPSGSEDSGEENRPVKEPIKREYIKLPEGTVICDDAEKAKYYCPDIFKPTVVPCRVNIETGEIQYACPVSGCDHTGKGCYYYNKWVTSVYDTGNYLIMKALDYPAGSDLILAYEWKSGNLIEISKKAQFTECLIPGVYDGIIYAYTTASVSSYTVQLKSIDLYSGEVSVVQNLSEDTALLFCDEGDVYGVNIRGPVRFYPLKEEPKTYKLPAGCEDYELRKPGMLYKTDAPAAIYDTKSKKTVNPDPELDITSPVRSGDCYYYQSRGTVETGRKSDGTEVKFVRYNNEIFRQSIDGQTEKYTINTDYHFIVYAASGDYVIGRLMYKFADDVYTPFEDLDHDHIRINLKTGDVQFLDLYKEHDYFL